MPVFYLTEYDGWEDQRGKADHSRKHSLGAAVPNRTSGACGLPPSSANHFPQWAEAQPSSWPISLLFSMKAISLFLSTRKNGLFTVCAELLG